MADCATDPAQEGMMPLAPLDAAVAWARAWSQAHPWEGCRLVVPTARMAEVARVRLALAGGAVGAQVGTLRGLAVELAQGRLSPVLPPAAAHVLLRQVLTEEAASSGAGAWTALPGTAVTHLLRVYEQMRHAGWDASDTPDERAVGAPQAAGAVGGEDGAGAWGTPRLHRVLTAFRRRMHPYGDRWDVYDAAVAALAEGRNAPAAIGVVAGASQAVPQARLLAALAERGTVRVFPLPAVSPADDAVASRTHLESVPCSGPAQEADAAARAVVSWLLAGWAPQSIAVVGERPLLSRVARRLRPLGVAVRGPAQAPWTTTRGAQWGRLALLALEDRLDDARALLSGPTLDPAASLALLERLAGRAGSARAALEAVAAQTGPLSDPDAAAMAELLLRSLADLTEGGSFAARAAALLRAVSRLFGAGDGEEAETGPDPAPAMADGEGADAAKVAEHLAMCDRVTSGEPDLRTFTEALWAELASLEQPDPEAPRDRVGVELLTWQEVGAVPSGPVCVTGLAAADLERGGGADLHPPADVGEADIPGGALPGGPPPGGPSLLTAADRVRAAAAALAGPGPRLATFTAVDRLGPRPPSDLIAQASVRSVPERPLDLLEARLDLLATCDVTDALLDELAEDATAPLAGPARWVRAARSDTVTDFDGQVRIAAGWTVREAWSVTALERFGRCPYQFYLAEVLGLGEADAWDGLAGVDVTGRERGTLAHRALERIRQAARAAAREPLQAADLPWVREVLAAWLDEQMRRVGEPALAAVTTRVLVEELSEVVAQDIAAGDGRTLASEWPFGEEEGVRAHIATPSGPVPLRGRIDRIVARDGGEVWVEDYKAGRLPTADTPGPDALQMPVYLIVARRVWGQGASALKGRYRSVAPRGGFESHWLDADAVDEAEVGRWIDAILEAARSGRFGPRPKGGTHCRACDYVQVCPDDVGTRARRKGTDQPLVTDPDTTPAARGGRQRGAP